MFINKQQTFATLFLGIFVISTLLIHFSASPAECAPNNNGNSNNKNNNNNGNNRDTRNGGLFSSLFRRQTGSSNSDSSSDSNSNSESTTEADLEDPQTQTELEAQKFVDSLPIPVSFTNR